MSYDLLVFDPAAAPQNNRADFMDWYDEQTEWEEDHGYDDPAVSTPALRAWFLEMIQAYPAMNGPYRKADQQPDDFTVTDYSVGRSVIYAAFSWSEAERAYETVFRLAGKHGLGFVDASGESGAVWFPDGQGGLTLAHEE